MPLKLELVSEIKSYLSADLGAAAEKIDQLIVASSVEEELSEGDKNQISEIILDYFRAIDKENHLSIATLFQFAAYYGTAAMLQFQLENHTGGLMEAKGFKPFCFMGTFSSDC